MLSEEERAQWMQWRLDGWSYGKIAKRAKTSRQRVYQTLAAPKAVREFVAKRAEYRCETCGLELGTSGHVHHANGKAKSWDEYEDIEHLQYLCWPCHRNVHGRPGGEARATVILQLRCPVDLYERLAKEVARRKAEGRQSSLNISTIEILETALDQGLHLYPPTEGR